MLRGKSGNKKEFVMNERNKIWNSKNVLVTGAAGFLGPWLIKELLKNNASVIALVRDQTPNSLFFTDKINKQVSVVYGDLLNFNLIQKILAQFNIDSVFHLGAQAIVGTANRSPLSTFKSNIEGTWNLLEACRLSSGIKRIVVASSDKAYGENKNLPYTEEAPLQGKHPYDVSKSCTDLISQSYYHTYNLPVCITRCGNFFGGGDLHFNRIIPGTIKSILDNKRPIIRSNGLFIRDYIYVKDVVDAYLTLAENIHRKEIVGQSFNFSTDKPFNVIEVVENITHLMNSNLQPIIENKASNEIPAQHLSSQKAHNLLNWNAQYGILKGLEETIEWYKKFFKIEKTNLLIKNEINLNNHPVL